MKLNQTKPKSISGRALLVATVGSWHAFGMCLGQYGSESLSLVCTHFSTQVYHFVISGLFLLFLKKLRF